MHHTSNKLYYLYLIAAVISCVFCEVGKYSDVPIYLLPFAYAVSLVICRNLCNRFSYLSVAIINSVCLIRYCIYPIMLVLEKSSGTYYANISQEAVYLMIYELFAIQFFLNWYIKKIDINNVNNGYLIQTDLGPINKVLIILLIPMGILFPSLLAVFRVLGIQGRGTAPGIIAVFFEIGIIVAYVYLLTLSSKKANRFSFFVSIGIAIGYIFMTMVGGENVRRWLFLWTGIPTVYILMKSYPMYRRSIGLISIVGIPLGIFFGSFAKFAITNISILEFANNFMGSEMLSEYFGGLNGLSFSIAHLPQDIKASSFTSTLTDILGNMPLVSKLFNTEIYSTQFIYQGLIERTDLICPLLGQSYTHFGFIGAPLLSIVMAALAVNCEKWSKSATTVYEVYTLIMMCVVFSLFMCLNTMIILTHIWNLVILLVLQHYNKKLMKG